MELWIVLNLLLLMMALLMVGIGVWALTSIGPINFWTGQKVDSAAITDVRGYNRANAKMWCVFSIVFIIPMFIMPFNIRAAAGVFSIGLAIGIGLLVAAHGRIRQRYSAYGK